MSWQTIDIYAATNPAFCALVLRAFCDGFVSRAHHGVDYPLIFLPIPILLSGNISTSIRHTNKNTGFINWIAKNPHVLINFHSRLKNTMEFSRRAVLFGIQHNLIWISEGIQILPSDVSLPRQLSWPVSDERGMILVYAKRLGLWLGTLDSVQTVLATMGVRP